MTPLEDLLQQCTVKISVPGGWGTGFFVAPGLILTCAHVVRKAADLQVTVSYPAWQQPLLAIVQAQADDRKTLDLALVELSKPLPDHPCVFLDEEPVAIGQALYSYGYLESYTNAAPVHPVNEGETGDTPPLLKLQGAQIEHGISGAALLNLKSGKVCGMVKETRAAGFDLGGGAIPTRVILEQFPELRSLQQAFHEGDKRWVNLITPPGLDFQPYLESIATTYAKWEERYTLIDAESKQRQTQESAPMFDFGLMVQTVQKQEREQPQQEKPAPEKVERFSVLDGLRKYALGEKPEPVLLIGRPGSGKSTALAKLLLEEATIQKSEFLENSDFSARIPVLVELRYWQGSLSELIHNAMTRHDPTLKAVPLDRLLTNALLLFDGVNELPSDEARTELIAFRHNHPNLPMIFTTRDLSLGGDLGIERKLEMQPLTEPQMQAFIRAYVPDQAEAMLGQLKDRLREFGQTPLLLWMLCEVFQQAPNKQLPSNLGGVFQAFTQMYEASSVRKHDVALLKGDVRPLSDRRLWKKALMAIAAIMMQGKTPVDFRVAIHRDEAETELSRVFPNEQFPVRDILDDLLKYHLLQNRSADQIEFRHQLIQEYYAAEYLLRLLQPPDGKPGLTDDQLKHDYLNYLKWTEPVALMLALVADEGLAVRVVEQALDVDLMLGARLAGEVKPEFQEQTVGLLNRLIEQKNLSEWLKVELWGKTRSEVPVSRLTQIVCNKGDRDLIFTAAYALRQIGSKSAVPMLLEALTHNSELIVYAALFSLGGIGDETAIPKLQQALNHEDDGIRAEATAALGELGYQVVVPDLLKALQDESGRVRAKAVEALGNLSCVSAIPALVKAMKESSTPPLGTFAKALAQINHDKAASELIKLLKDPSYETRKKAAEALGEVGGEEAIQELVTALKDRDICCDAARAIKKLDGQQAIPKLIKILEHENFGDECAACILGEMGDQRAVQSLINVLFDRNSELAANAAEALGKLGDKRAIPELRKLLQTNLSGKVREETIIALGKLGDEQVLPNLLNILENPYSGYLWWQVFTALEKIGGQSVIFALIQTLQSSNPLFRWRSAEVLGNLTDEAAIPGLLMGLTDKDSSVRLKCAEALGKFKNTELLQKLVTLLRHADSSNVRESAASALGNLEDELAVEALLEALEDPEFDVRYAATKTLVSLSNPHLQVQPKIFEVLTPYRKTKCLNDNFIYSILAIQANCKFYNYDVFQAHLAAQKADRQTHPNSDRPSTTNPVVYDLRGAAIANLAHEVHGNQITQPKELP